MNVIEYACKVQDKRNGLDSVREAVLEVLAEVDLDPNTRQRLLDAFREKGVI